MIYTSLGFWIKINHNVYNNFCFYVFGKEETSHELVWNRYSLEEPKSDKIHYQLVLGQYVKNIWMLCKAFDTK